MLTIKSNFNNFRSRQGEGYTPEDLELLCKALIKSDIINFPIKKEMSAGYTEAIAWKIAERVRFTETGKYLVINDISLQAANVLVSLGVNPKNIYLAYGKWTKKAEPDTDPTLYLLMKQYIKANVVETFTVIKLEEIFTLGTKFDGIIANPPYGKVGANITKTIIDKVDFDQYINLLPANDYKRNTDKDLFNFQSNMETIKNGFADATVTTHLANIHKTKVNNMTVDEFERSNYIDRSLDKYFEENSTRDHYAINNYLRPYLHFDLSIYDNKTCFCYGRREIGSGHLPYSKNVLQYKWNKLETVTMQDLIDAKAFQDVGHGRYYCTYLFIKFGTPTEKQNFVDFVYSINGFRFISKLFTALNTDGDYKAIYFPKVDWTRTWTVEELLADYGYTEGEIAKVMADLENFKDMERD